MGHEIVRRTGQGEVGRGKREAGRCRADGGRKQGVSDSTRETRGTRASGSRRDFVSSGSLLLQVEDFLALDELVAGHAERLSCGG